MIDEPAADMEDQAVDLQFSLQGYAIPHDYLDALWSEVRSILPWMATDTLTGLHTLTGLSPGDGKWYLSRRSRLILRLARPQVGDAIAALSGAQLQLGSHMIEAVNASVIELVHTSVLYARFVTFQELNSSTADGGALDEGEFQAACQKRFAAMSLAPQLICGKQQRTDTSSGTLVGFSLMLLGLGVADTQKAQRHGLGDERKRGCGIFIPHKPTAAM
ncbi:MAG: type I-MYXAN CRISPR-associated protein Cas6/Cmx6 [Rhodocyclaceae bacterium]|jgi:CRISPR-associated protein Cas6|nr:type I-MYXAN CRISPR-associated protein Cas6/Cmx6 [Rhodocyclaceae bacterium]